MPKAKKVPAPEPKKVEKKVVKPTGHYHLGGHNNK